MWQALNFVLLMACLLLLAILVLNAISWLIVRIWPKLLLSENERLAIDYLARFGGEFRPFLPEWFDIEPQQWDIFAQDIEIMISRGGHAYSPFVEVRHPPYSGQVYNFHEAGFRHVRNQGPWPVSSDYFNVFFFWRVHNCACRSRLDLDPKPIAGRTKFSPRV